MEAFCDKQHSGSDIFRLVRHSKLMGGTGYRLEGGANSDPHSAVQTVIPIVHENGYQPIPEHYFVDNLDELISFV